jgi:hypothetical protein
VDDRTLQPEATEKKHERILSGTAMAIIRRAARRKASTPHGATPLYGVHCHCLKGRLTAPLPAGVPSESICRVNN